jgi:hypothetical protein
MSSGRYQLIIQRPGASSADYDEVVELEDRLRRRLGETATVDGHDLGSGEANIFILTDDPILVFDAIRPLLERVRRLRVAYREIGAQEFLILYPLTLRTFSIT